MGLENLVGCFFMKKNGRKRGRQLSAIFIATRINKHNPNNPYANTRMDELVLRSILSPTYEHLEPNDVFIEYNEIPAEAIPGLLRDRLVETK